MPGPFRLSADDATLARLVPDCFSGAGLWIASGGYRIGIGHATADTLVARIAGDAASIPLPASFEPAAAR